MHVETILTDMLVMVQVRWFLKTVCVVLEFGFWNRVEALLISVVVIKVLLLLTSWLFVSHPVVQSFLLHVAVSTLSRNSSMSTCKH